MIEWHKNTRSRFKNTKFKNILVKTKDGELLLGRIDSNDTKNIFYDNILDPDNNELDASDVKWFAIINDPDESDEKTLLQCKRMEMEQRGDDFTKYTGDIYGKILPFVQKWVKND